MNAQPAQVPSATQDSPGPPSQGENPALDWDVVIVGAGLSGIGAARRLRLKHPQLRITILEARERLGGTWDLHRYPGIRSDSDMYTLGYDFKPWTGERAIAQGPEILGYLQEAAQESGVLPLIRYQTQVQAAHWLSPKASWTLELQTPEGAQSLRTRFVYLCAGYYSYTQPHSPTFAGQETFRGRLFHSQLWPQDLAMQGQRVVVIGSGATAISLVPALARLGAQVTMLQRSPTDMGNVPSRDATALALRRLLPERWAYRLVRGKNVLLNTAIYTLARRAPKTFRSVLRRRLKAALPAHIDIDRHFAPRYAPWDERLCAVTDDDLFRCISEGSVQVVTDDIAHFTPEGVALASGQVLPADVVVLATGLQLQMLGGIRLTVDGQTLASADLLLYKGMMLSGVPNLFQTFGYTNASWTLRADLIAHHVCRLLQHMRKHGHRTVTPQAPADMPRRPFLNLKSGYIRRAQAILPQQGTRAPWTVSQNYWRDWLALRLARINPKDLHWS